MVKDVDRGFPFFLAVYLMILNLKSKHKLPKAITAKKHI